MVANDQLRVLMTYATVMNEPMCYKQSVAKCLPHLNQGLHGGSTLNQHGWQCLVNSTGDRQYTSGSQRGGAQRSVGVGSRGTERNQMDQRNPLKRRGQISKG